VGLFSSDSQHVEGGRNPIERLERRLDAAEIGARAREAFHFDDLVDLMGPVLARRGIRAAPAS